MNDIIVSDEADKLVLVQKCKTIVSQVREDRDYQIAAATVATFRDKLKPISQLQRAAQAASKERKALVLSQGEAEYLNSTARRLTGNDTLPSLFDMLQAASTEA